MNKCYICGREFTKTREGKDNYYLNKYDNRRYCRRQGCVDQYNVDSLERARLINNISRYPSKNIGRWIPLPLNQKGIYDKELTQVDDTAILNPWNDPWDWGIHPNEGFVVLDIDDRKEANDFYVYLNNNNYKFNCLETTRGAHFWFRTNTIHNNLVGFRNGLGMTVDIRSGGKKCYLSVKKNGQWRKWTKWYGTDLDIVEDIFLPSKELGKETNETIKIGKGQGRNDLLFNLINLYKKLGYTQEDIIRCVEYVNNNQFVEPLLRDEISNILSSNKNINGKYEGIHTENYYNNGEWISITYKWNADLKAKEIVNIQSIKTQTAS